MQNDAQRIEISLALADLRGELNMIDDADWQAQQIGEKQEDFEEMIDEAHRINGLNLTNVQTQLLRAISMDLRQGIENVFAQTAQIRQLLIQRMNGLP